MRTLKRGSKGEAVRRLQRLLNTKLRIHLHVDGDFRKETEKAVKRFQGMNGLAIDGIVGPDTWAALQAPVKPAPPDDPGPPPIPPQKGTQASLGLIIAIGVALVAVMVWAL